MIGVCIAVASLRRIATKLLVGAAARDDYQLHCEAIAHSRRPSPMAEALQNALDQRYATALRKTAALKTTEALATWWQLSSCATTFKRCTPARPSLKVAWI